MTQPSFLDQCRRDEYLVPRDTHVTQPAEVKRLSGQNLRIVERLERGPATNRELAEIALKYTSRVHDARQVLRRHGRSIEVVEQDIASGRVVYAIVPWPTERASTR